MIDHMRTALRAPLVAGTVAVVGAGAFAAAPVHSALPEFAVPSTARVALAAFLNPVEQLLSTAQVTQNYLFGAYYNGGSTPTPGAGEANWSYAGFDQTGGDTLNYLLYTTQELGFYNYVGLSPNSTQNASPVLRALQINAADYINNALTGVNLAVIALANGVWDYPSALLTAGQLALQGQFAQAFAVLGDAVFGPISEAGQAMLEAGTYVFSNVVARLGAVVAALPQIFTTFAGTAVGGTAVLAEKTAAVIGSVFASLSTLDFEGAWNAAVTGWLGPSGLPGTALNLTTGAGVQTGPILNPATDIAGNFVPSWRTSYQAAVWTIADALSVSAAPTAAVAAPASARVARSAATADRPEGTGGAIESAGVESAGVESAGVENATGTEKAAGAEKAAASASGRAAASDRSSAKQDRGARSAARSAG